MDEEKKIKLSEIACKLSGMTFILKYYCEHFAEDIPEISNLADFSNIINKTSNELFDLL